MNDCRALLHVLTVSLLVLTLDADSEECFLQMKVRRNTVYEASVGQELRINCTIAFCNSSPPAVTWIKLNKKLVPVNMSSDIKTEWKMLKDFEGVSYLTFQNIHKRDSGVYQCESDGDVSHYINISVYGGVPSHTLENDALDGSDSDQDSLNYTDTEGPVALDSSHSFVFGLVRTLIFIFGMIVIIICVTSKPKCKGKTRTTANRQSSCSQQDVTIYENDL
ncbi:uncharacterized protein LOC114432375 [Parambassis ranga]|uniref:Uncharacterized protein LOC114432375 n=1 Tax=Parambassis ranga TaxID=210632 RepID=A0A6P7I731_9TELE|nr:uncharacterized protein LOC114432375 [Parambassis ranga]